MIANNSLMEPDAGKFPDIVSFSRRDLQNLSRLLVREARKITKIDQLHGLGLRLGQLFECFVKCDEVVIFRRNGWLDFAQRYLLSISPTFQSFLAMGLINQKSTHRFSSRSKEVAARIPVLCLFDIDKPKVGIMHQCRRLQRLPRLFLRHLRGGELAQLIVNERQQFRGCLGIAVFDRLQDAGDVRHAQDCNIRRFGSPPI